MKKLFILFLLSCSLGAFAQNKEKQYNMISYDSFKEYPQVNHAYIYNDIAGQFIKVNNAPSLISFTSPTVGSAVENGPWMGSKQTSYIQLMNYNVEVQYIYDINGVLRESSFSFPFNKKKKSHPIRYINPQ